MNRGWRSAAACASAAVALMIAATGTAHAGPETQSARQWRIAVIGDSLAVGRGIGSEQAYPAVLGRLLQQSGWSIEMRTFGKSGDTTVDGIDSTDESIEWQPDVTIVAVGGNDGIRGFRVQQMEHNLRRIIRNAQEAGSRVILTGMRANPRYGPPYEQRFENTFHRVAADTGTDLMPFLLAGVAGRKELNQRDRVHPNVEGADQVARGVWPYVNDALIALTRR